MIGGSDVHSSHGFKALPSWAEIPLNAFFLHPFLYFSLAVFIAPMTSLLTSFHSDSEPVKKILFFLLRISFSSFVTQDLLFGKMVIVLEGMMLSTQKLMSDETMSTCSPTSLMELGGYFEESGEICSSLFNELVMCSTAVAALDRRQNGSSSVFMQMGNISLQLI